MNFDSANNQDFGFIKIWKSLEKWEWFSDPNMVALWVHLLLKANWQDKRWCGHVIKRGQCVIGRSQLSKETGISEQTIKTCLNRLKSTSQITIKSTSKFSVLTIENYEFYQQRDHKPTSKSTSKSTSNQPATNQQLTTPLEGEEREEREEGIDSPLNPPEGKVSVKEKKSKQDYSQDFEEFWKQYPKKAGKTEAYKAYVNAIKRASPQQILNGTMAYANECTQRDPKYIKHAQGWLNGDRWQDQQDKSTQTNKPNGENYVQGYNQQEQQPSASMRGLQSFAKRFLGENYSESHDGRRQISQDDS